MDANASQRPLGGGPRPRLRCPACSTMVELPAVTCPKCRTDLRTGYTPPDNRALVRNRIVAGVLLVLLALIAATVLPPFFHKEEVIRVQPAEPPAASGTGTDLNEAVEAVQSLAETGVAVGATPAQAQPILNMTREAAGEVSEKWQQVEEIAEDNGGE